MTATAVQFLIYAYKLIKGPLCFMLKVRMKRPSKIRATASPEKSMTQNYF